MLGTCNACVRLHSRVTSSGTTVNSWIIFFIYCLIYLFIFSFLSFICLFCLFLFCGCWFCFYFCWPFYCCLLLSFSFLPLYLSAVFISVWVELGLIFHWSENRISYFRVIYKYLSMGMELGVIKELCIILYIYLFSY